MYVRCQQHRLPGGSGGAIRWRDRIGPRQPLESSSEVVRHVRCVTRTCFVTDHSSEEARGTCRSRREPLRHDACVEEVVLEGQDGRRLTLRRSSSRDSEAVWSYGATLTIPEGSFSTDVYDDGDWLGPFVRDLAESWRGFEGVKEYTSLEGQMRLECRHDGLGAVECRVILRQPAPPEWSAEAVHRFGAGADLDRVAGEVEAFVAASIG